MPTSSVPPDSAAATRAGGLGALDRLVCMAPLPTLEYTSTRRPDVQAQYAHDVSEATKAFGDQRPCPMGAVVFKARPADPREPVLGENRYPYVNFADQVVLRHELLIPQPHVPTLDALREVDEEAWRRFYLKQDRLRAEGKALFIHGLGSAAMSAPAHAHAHVFTLGERITAVDYDRAGRKLRLLAGTRVVVDSERQAPAPLAPWEPEPSVCDEHYLRVFGSPKEG